jgi:hypothetical protein
VPETLTGQLRSPIESHLGRADSSHFSMTDIIFAITLIVRKLQAISNAGHSLLICPDVLNLAGAVRSPIDPMRLTWQAAFTTAMGRSKRPVVTVRSWPSRIGQQTAPNGRSAAHSCRPISEDRYGMFERPVAFAVRAVVDDPKPKFAPRKTVGQEHRV